MSKLLPTALLATALAGGGYLQLAKVQAQAAGPALARQATAAQPRAAGGGSQAVAPPQRAVLDQYCVTCHNERLKTADLMLDKLDISDVQGNAETLEKVVRKLRKGLMPPDGRPRPDQATVDSFATSLETALDRVAVAAPNPGRVASHRLNRSELHVNVIRDLLGLEINGEDMLPSDMAGFGFDNNADVLAITPGLMARYMTAATKISRVALASPDNRPMMQVYKVEFGTRQDARMGEDMPFATHGGLAVRHTFPLDGEYTFQLRLKRDGTVSTILGIEEDESEIELNVDNQLVKRFTIGGKFKGPDPGVLIAPPEDDVLGQQVHNYRMNADKELEIRVPIKAGTRLVSASFADSMPAPGDSGGRAARGRNGAAPGVDMLYITGPYNSQPTEDTASRRQIFICRPTSDRDEEPCARKIIATLARRAYRRPVADADVEPLLSFYKTGRSEKDFDAGIERAVEAMLSSPDFLIRVEREPAGTKPGTVYRLSDVELASRLSFFLWASIPDDELLGVAERGKLKDPAVLAQQVRRMLADRRATRFIDDFAAQWLQVRNIHSQEPDAQFQFDPTLRESMARETELFFESQVREDHPIPELLRANYTYLNEQLARHYGVEDIYGSHFRRVTLTDENRFGLLGQASILTVTSHADRTSVVKRGYWILDNLLGSPPPAPPPNCPLPEGEVGVCVPPLKENVRGALPTALRERMEQHRNSPVCSSCHSRMDPLGFALEHFDAVGKYRETDGGAAIDSSITLAGQTIKSPKAFRDALLGQGSEFVRTVAEKLMTYALGRGVDYGDASTVRQLVHDLAQNDNRWSSLIMGIVKSPQFEMRRAPVPVVATPVSTSAAARR